MKEQTSNNENEIYAFDKDKNKVDLSENIEKVGQIEEEVNSLPAIYSGTSDPTSSLGEDGDIYLQYEE